MKVLAVGDIHTKVWIIDEIEKIMNEYDRVLFVGDFADDWKSTPVQTIETWKRLFELQRANPKKVFPVVGNHDYIYVHDIPVKSSGYNYMTQHLLNMPENLYLKVWLNEMPFARELDDVIYSHAGFTQYWEEGFDVEALWNDESPLWARPGDFVDLVERYGKNKYKDTPQVFGHTPSETCWEVQPNVWCIDTFSTYQDGTPIGDFSVLEIEDGKKFTKRKIKNDNNSTNSLSERVS